VNKTVRRELIVKTANDMIMAITRRPDLSKAQKDEKRASIFVTASEILLVGNSYVGFGWIRGLGISEQWYTDGMPGLSSSGEDGVYMLDDWARFLY